MPREAERSEAQTSKRSRRGRSLAPREAERKRGAAEQPKPTCSEIAQTAKLFLNFLQQGSGQSTECTNEPAVVDGTALVDHDLTRFFVTGGAPRKGHPQEILPRDPGRTRQDPSGRMPCVVE